ncbi:MAG: FKBP-type peptidyl-prolyl cis-trans isomerase [Muribaculaceae bacterium]|nr:FKBP-type peptidyl-prolyl cis-trans isomerase [Muribaculaceae bacterium]
MKKILIGAAVVAAITAASCSHKDGSEAAGTDEKFAVSAATSDSVNTLFGSYVGSSVLADYSRLDSAMKAEQPKADILKGLQYALGAPEERGVAVGMHIGLQMLGTFQQLEQNGVKVDRSAVLNAFKKAFLADSVDGTYSGMAQMEYQALMGRIQQESRDFENAKKANSPEALANVAAGEKYLAVAKEADPSIQTSESGLSYKIENAGDTAKITRRDVAQIKYTGRLVDGTVFDSSDDARLSPAGVVPGFGEGLQMLGKGGKATLYIPGKLAYGVDGAPRAGIGPNAMLIFDIEVLDVNPGRK